MVFWQHYQASIPQQSRNKAKSDLWPSHSILLPFKKIIQNYAFKKATIIHTLGDPL
jgi:hypothetical protein